MAQQVLRSAGKLLGLAALVVVLALPAGAAAVTNEPIAQTGGMTATLPILGTSLTVEVTLDPAGNISGVALDPSGFLTATKTTPTKVELSSADGTATARVKAKGSQVTIAAATKKLADLTGTGTWSADVFGTGTRSTVEYTVGDDGTGKPTVTIGDVSAAAGITATPLATPKKAWQKEHASRAIGGVLFASNGFVKRLSITVNVGKSGAATLRIALSGRDRQKLTGSLAELAGSRTWNGHLGDGTKVSVTYHVTAEGTVVFDAASGAPATSKAKKHGLAVRFTGTRVGVSIALRVNRDGTYTLVASGLFARGRHGNEHDRNGRNHNGGSGGINAAGGKHGASSAGARGHGQGQSAVAHVGRP